MFKNIASQKVTLLAIDTAANTPKTGDAANLTAYVSKDDGAVTVLGDTSATELDATNAPGLYAFDLTQGETNADKLVFSGKSSTSGIKVIPLMVYTVPPNFTTTAIDGSGRVDVSKIAGTSQTARDIGASVLLSAGSGTGQLDFTSGVVKSNLSQILGTALTETAGLLAGAFKKFFNVATPTGTVNSIPDAVAGAASGLAIVGSNMGTATSVTGAVGSVTGAVGSVTGAVGSVTGSVGSVTGAVGSVTAAVTVAVGGIPSGAHAAAELNAIADALLDRNMATGTDSGADNTTTRTVRQALRRLRNKEAIAAGTGTVYKENDSTASWTYTATTTAGDPLSAVDPS